MVRYHPENSLMGMPDELLVIIVSETLGPRPIIPFDIFTNRNVLRRSILAPFFADLHRHLEALAYEHCYINAVFDLSIVWLTALNTRSVSQDVFRNIRHIRIQEPTYLLQRLADSPNSTDIALSYYEEEAFGKLRRRLPNLRSLEIAVSPEAWLIQLTCLNRVPIPTVRPTIELYYQALLSHLKLVRDMVYPEATEVRITLPNKLLDQGLASVRTRGLSSWHKEMQNLREEFESREPVVLNADKETGSVDWSQVMKQPYAVVVWRC